ncbi:3-oxoacyl-[acyl-carrier protein] reductase [Kitasatospora sp. MAA19]|uniref:3-oxoacyl-ACP reductase FabG n=1 Tax=unclassified Kitasatospora TaxID=2633591 RepID=UPI002473C00E|nr:3-oxoacyl-ACP reductase FabG [Kitasatospora sp. MAA19]MDH6709105.1 3-oxoacyl-[acyl-carrier protein] reductase [Kitasatospora sp. MAA19]
MSGRSVLVIGGSRGIGLEVARQMAEHGNQVAVTSRSGEAPAGLFAVKCDVTSPADVEQAFALVEAEHGPVEVVVVNAGVTRDTLLLRMSEDDWAATIETNLTGAFRCAKRALRSMLRVRRGGRLVFISSAVALAGEAGQANYAASKAGLIGFARSVAREYGSRGITSNVVAPGLTATDMTAVLGQERLDEIVAQVPLGRIAQPSEIAAAVRFVASPEAGYITGAVIPVDGGAAMGH